jgi:hypothetical protein
MQPVPPTGCSSGLLYGADATVSAEDVETNGVARATLPFRLELAVVVSAAYRPRAASLSFILR